MLPFRRLSCVRTRLFSTNRPEQIVRSPMNDKGRFSSPMARQPLPNFILQNFLSQENKSSVSITDGMTGRQLTFGQVFYATTSLTKSLKKVVQISKNDVVSIVSPNHLHYMTAFLSIAMARGVSTCVNPLNTTNEISYQLLKTNAKTTFVHPACLSKVLEVVGTMDSPHSVIVMDDNTNKADIEKAIHIGSSSYTNQHQIKIYYMSDLLCTIPFDKAEEQLHFDTKTFDPHSILTIPFSSGTTGKSKGVLLSHSNIISNVIQGGDFEDHSTRTINLCPLPFFHIYGLTGMLISHNYGGQLIFMPQFDLVKFLELIEKYHVTRAFAVPPIILALAKHPIVEKYNLSSLKEVSSGAAPLGLEVQLLAAKRLNCLVKQGWGMTETSPLGTVTPVHEMTGVHKDKATSGVLVAGTEAKIVDPLTQENLPSTQEGELLIRGPQVMRGYLNDPEATQRTLVENGWMHTGDIGFFDEKGYLYITDRAKELIKYKGLQVPPAELEALIGTMKFVKDVIIIPVPDEEAGEVPRAYVVKQDNTPNDFTEQTVIDFVNDKVAPHKRLRGGVIFTDSIPKSPSGKLLRRVQIDIDRKLHP